MHVIPAQEVKTRIVIRYRRIFQREWGPLHSTCNNGPVFDFREIDVKTSLESRVRLNESGLINGEHFSI